MNRCIEEIIESRDRTFVTIQRLNSDLEYHLQYLSAKGKEQAIETFSRKVYRYTRLMAFLEDTIAKIESTEWDESIQNEINQLINN